MNTTEKRIDRLERALVEVITNGGVKKSVAERLMSDLGVARHTAPIGKQDARVLHAIYHFQKENGFSPTYEWLMVHLGKRSKSGIARSVTSLIHKGYISNFGKQKRGLIVEKIPEALEDPDYQIH